MRGEVGMKKIYHTQDRDYTLRFEPLSNSNGTVHFIDHYKDEESTVGFTVDDREFGYRVQQNFPSIIADLIDLAVAIYALDRLAFQPLRQGQNCIHVVLPVRHPELLNTQTFQAKIENLLTWTTGSRWSFDFQKRTILDRLVEHQSLPIAPQGCEVALWSGGLDALAGLYTRLQDNPGNSFVLFGTGSNTSIYARQSKVAQKIQPIFPGRCNLYRVPIHFSGSSEHRKNKMSRARGVAFTLLGSACSYLMGQRVLYVYENGVGAINLPYRASAVGLDHSRSVHPRTLTMVSDIVSEIIGENFQVKNPFLFWTKAEMCRALAEDKRSDLSALTMSCDSPHRQQPTQCGYCSSCLLRRQSLAASKVEDKTRYVVLHGRRSPKNPRLHLSHMLEQVKTFRNLLSTSDNLSLQWKALTQKFQALDNIVDQSAETEGLQPADMQIRLIKLYQNYVTEWDTVESQIAIGLLSKRGDQQALSRCLNNAQQG
jgi:Queuosine biosynthesis protein QueC